MERLGRSAIGPSGASQGQLVWRSHIDDPVLASYKTRHVDSALFMVETLTDYRA